MAIIQDFSLDRTEDATVTIVMTPPTPIGGWSIRTTLTKRYGSVSGIFDKYVSSGLNGASGITVVDSGLGVFNVKIDSNDTSGLNYGNYVHCSKRLDSGFVTVLTEGFVSIMPENG